MKDLQAWLEKVKAACNGKEIFQIVDEFRPGDWTDEERAMMSKTYIAALSSLAPEALTAPPQNGSAADKAAATPADTQEAELKEPALESTSDPDDMADEEVWYEKM